MGNSPREEYIRALYDLSKGDPARWATFIEAFKVFTLFEYERSLSTPSGEAHIALGMNRRMRDLRDDFIHIENLADKLRK
jgi:hypothetical protein